MNKDTRSVIAQWHGILHKNVGKAIDRFVNDEEARSKVANKVAPELLKFIPGGGLAYGLVTGTSPLLDDVNKSDDLSKYVKELHAKLDRLEREVRELKTLYEKQHEQNKNGVVL
ncbi:hypothetical protein TIFTF001_036091 [Ficus carica]|uniref:Uncharacterized protein n=1 Tax=Ficus carica TaxID=3494 RepID=A0AA88E660_FICCA|nr:hypothetical protein TIFTF001_036023 [Ficus carica]GMN66966.1 hypothetical protein TIFTF001_036027 [Ficus carica]GMN67019.1 hypothetical protein TIFTF001_036087 [Ficus carica]GMN67030.1 hypothetical protein TIFTF001_036091 [Ficus carica]